MKKHTEDFKRETVRIALTSGLSREWVAADLGVWQINPAQVDCPVSTV